MNVLPIEKQTQIISALVEGNSIRATARMVGVEHKTVMRVLLRVGENCADLLDAKMQSLPCKIVQMDEIWTFVGKKEKRVNGTDNPEVVGDQYVFVAMRDPKLQPKAHGLSHPINSDTRRRYSALTRQPESPCSPSNARSFFSQSL
jgi:hypothetical protein